MNSIHKDSSFIFALLIFFIFILLIQFPAGADEISEPGPPYSVEQVRAWHRQMEPWPWLGQPEQLLHLRSEKDHELLLAIRGYARGGTFVIFAKHNGQWSQISDEIEQAHHPLHMLKTDTDGWHDFETFVPAWGSGGAEVWVFTYGWNGKKYILMNQRDGRWCEQVPFMSDKNLCPNGKAEQWNTL